jgi:hypothetical protein
LTAGCSLGLAFALSGAAPGAVEPAGELLAFHLPTVGGKGVVLEVDSSRGRAAPGRVTIFVPTGYGLNTGGAVGKLIGSVDAAFVTAAKPSSPDLASGELTRGDPAALPADPAAQACAPGTHAGLWNATVKAGSRSVLIRFYVDPTSGAETALGAFKLIACLASPYVPEAQGGAPGGVRFFGLFVGVLDASVFTLPPAGTYLWRMLLTPYTPGTATLDTAATFEARTRVASPHTLTEHLQYLRKTKTLVVTGRLLALGKPRARIPVTIFIEPRGGSSSLATVRTRSDGRYSLRKRVLPRKKARVFEVVAVVDEVRGACVEPPVAPAGCVDENLSPPVGIGVNVKIPKRGRR